MRLNILADAEWQSGVGDIAVWLTTTGYWDDFQIRNYGDGLDGVSIFLICRDPELRFKRRIRHSKKDKKIYMDIILKLSDFVGETVDQRKKKIVDALLKEVPEVVGKYKIEGFDTRGLLADFREKFASLKI